MKILTDNAADLSPEEAKELGIRVAPLYIQFPDEQVRAGDISPEAFYDRLQELYPEVPTTAMPAPGEFAEIFREMPDDEDVLAIHISSGLSGTIEASRLGAAQAEREVITVDSKTLSGGERFQVLAAARAALNGFNIETILKRLEKIREATEVIYTLDTLEYLQKGGRIGRVQALAGSLLQIKPVIKVDKTDGKYSTVGRGRTLRKALDQIVDYLERIYGPTTPLWISVMHGQICEQAEQLASLLRERLSISRLEILRISPVLGVHTGPGIVGATAVPIALMEN